MTTITDIEIVAHDVAAFNAEAIVNRNTYAGTHPDGHAVDRMGLGPVETADDLGLKAGMQMIANASIRPGTDKDSMWQNRLAVEWLEPQPDGRRRREAVKVWYVSVDIRSNRRGVTVSGGSGATEEDERGTRVAMMYAFAQTMIRIGFMELDANDPNAPHLFDDMVRHARAAAEAVRDIVRGDVAFGEVDR